MAKKIIHDYTFTPDTQDSAGADIVKGSITLKGIIPRERFLLMTDVTSGTIIQNFADTTLGITSVTPNHSTDETVVILEANTTTVDSSNSIQIFVEDILGQEVHLAETYVDPVSKIRVSNPENLIDTDFEYGLQSTKWETLELVKNIPTFFSRNGDLELSVTEINTTEGSANISVATAEPHGMSRGNPILVVGTTAHLANGGFVVTAIQDDNTFSFAAKDEIPTTGNIKDTYTQIFIGNVYSGTEFDLSNISGITTDEGLPKSTLTVTTKWPTAFTEGTSFFLSNSFAKANIEFSGDSTGVSTHLYGPQSATRASKTAVNEVADPGFSALGGVDLYSLYQPDTNPYHNHEFNDGLAGRPLYYGHSASTLTGYPDNNFTSHGDKHWRSGLYFDPATITVDTVANTIAFPFDHDIPDWQYMYYHVGAGNTAIGGMFDRLVYMIKVVNDTTISIMGPNTRPGYSNATDEITGNILSLTAASVSGLISKSGFLFAVPFQNSTQGRWFTCLYDYASGWNYHGTKMNAAFKAGTQPAYAQTTWAGWKWQMIVPLDPPGGQMGSGYVHSTVPASNTGWHCARWGSYYGVPFYYSFDANRIQQASSVEHISSNNPGYSAQFWNRAIGPNPPGSFTNLSDASPNPGQPGFKSRFHYAYQTGQNSFGFRTDTANSYLTYTGRSHYGRNTVFYFNTPGHLYGYNGAGTSYYVNHPVHWVPYLNNTMANSFYFPGHTFLDGDQATFTWDSGQPGVGYPTSYALDSAPRVYEIDYVNTNRVRLLDSVGAEVNLVTTGDSNLDYTMTVNQFNPIHNSILMAGNNLQDGDPVTYTNNGATDISGLTTGSEYYITNRSTNYVSMATTQGLWTDNIARELDQQGKSPTAVDTSANALYGGGSTAWTDGSLIRFTTTAVAPKGLGDGRWYYIKKYSGNTTYLQFFTNKIDALAGTSPVLIGDTGSGNMTIKESTIVDLTGVDSGTHSVSANFIGAADGVYNLDSSIGVSGDTFTLIAPNMILKRTISGRTPQLVDLNQNAFRYPEHGLLTGNEVFYKNDSLAYPIGQLSDSSTYFAKKINNNWFRLAATEAEALDSASIHIAIDSASGGPSGLGRSTFYSNTIIGETSGPGILSMDSDNKIITGTDTNFTSHFNAGSVFNIFIVEKLDSNRINTVNDASDYLVDSSHGISTGTTVIMGGNMFDPPVGTDSNEILYARAVDGNNLSLHRSPAKATSDSDKIPLGAHTGLATGYRTIARTGETIERTVAYVNSKLKITMDSAPGVENDSASYGINSTLLMRGDGFALHRPYDGGVELIPPTNPDARMIRQTRKYFRYQSGKGIQVSYAVNFKPPVDIETFVRGSGATAHVGEIKTRYPNRMSAGLEIQVEGATNSGGSKSEEHAAHGHSHGWNGQQLVSGVIDPYTFSLHMGGGDSVGSSEFDSDHLPSDLAATGSLSFHVEEWERSSLRCGLYDDQNGLLFEFDGQDLYVIVRSSIQQLSGTTSVEFNSGKLVGSGTKWSSQLSVGDSIVIKGVSYTITQISSDTSMYILPSYRGVTTSGCIITKTNENRVKQSDWNLDKADGTGKYGFKLDLSHIQMAYIDYSWYGAGKVRWGFKDQNGNVRYVHEIAHGNVETEAYMRSGNVPARYEIENVGKPTYVPALAHWGTSVIMDGGFDDDKAYVFTANSLTNSITAGSTLTVDGRFEQNEDEYQIWNYDGGGYQEAGFGLLLASTSGDYNTLSAGMSLSDSSLGVNTGTTLQDPENTQLYPRQPYQPDVWTRYKQGGRYTYDLKDLLLIDQAPAMTTYVDSDHTVNITEAGAISPTKDLPVMSIRLAPSVDTNTPGLLGEREVVNRMQMRLSEVDILSTHSVEVELRLNGLIDNNNWQRVTNPSLSQLIYHSATDEITGGTVVYSFNALGGTGTTNRTPALTSKLLGEVATLGNSILGGNAIFPDGPDVLTVVAKLREDPSTVNNTQAYSISGRISWTESQA